MNKLICLFVGAVMVMACSSKKEHGESADGEEWAEMESFHMIMAEAYHPFKDSLNLSPAKRLADTLAMESEKWSKAALPESMNNDEVKSRIEKLKTNCRSLAGLVKNGDPDDRIGAALEESHESFHLVMESWRHKDKK